LIARRKKAFYRLCSLLRRIEADLDDLDTVKALNLRILKEIIRDEKHIARHRKISKGLRASLRNDRWERAEAKCLKTKIARADEAVKRYFQQIFIWKCIGDGLAYAYIHSVNIKHAFFDTESMSPRPEPGFIHGKDGLVNEVGLLFSAIEHKVPAVLCDITNVIRYGDVCLLGGSDPVPLEVKSSKGLNQRESGRRRSSKSSQGFSRAMSRRIFAVRLK
jgi:hypothetical protein